MNKSYGIIGSIFVLTASILFSTRYICAAIGATKSNVWSDKDFGVFLSNTPLILLYLSIIALILGIIFIGLEFKNSLSK